MKLSKNISRNLLDEHILKIPEKALELFKNKVISANNFFQQKNV